MPLYTEDEFKKIFTATARTNTEQLQFVFECATDELTDILGTAAVDDWILPVPTNLVRAGRIRRAHGMLAYSILLFNVGSRMRDAGIVERERDENNSVTNQYKNIDDVLTAAAEWRRKALGLLTDYIISIPSPSMEVQITQNIPVGFVF